MTLLHKILSQVTQIAYPSTCSLCNSIVTSQRGLCINCWKDLSFCTGQLCTSCGIPIQHTELSDETDTMHCESCYRFPHQWSIGRSAISYEKTGRDIVLSLKHADRTDLVPLCGQWMIQTAHDVIQEDSVLVPVPLHWTRVLKRKYNQSLELARYIGNKTGTRIDPSVLKRTQRTASQGNKKREERYENVRHAFRVCKNVTGAHIILVDDVMTTGATLDACTAVLLEAGARRVDVLVLARVGQDFLQQA